MDRVSVFGAGHVGATTAFYLALRSGLDLRMIDVVEGRAVGLALDIQQSLSYVGSLSTVRGSEDPSLAEGSDVVVITAGRPRKPGMSRLDLTHTNAPIVGAIAGEVARLAPESVVIVVTNPVDEMTHLAWERTGFPPHRIVGMAGVLDTSRYRHFIARATSRPAAEVEAFVLGSHGDDMVPLVSATRVGEAPLSEVLGREELEEVVEKTRRGGAEIVGHLKEGSAYFAPAVSIAMMVMAVLGDTGELLPVSARLQGQYGIGDVFLGVPARLGREGVVEVVELPVSEEEKKKLSLAAGGIKDRVRRLREGSGE